jgi:hypothetical protein
MLLNRVTGIAADDVSVLASLLGGLREAGSKLCPTRWRRDHLEAPDPKVARLFRFRYV